MEQHKARIDPVSGVLVVDGLTVDNAEVVRECRHWSSGQRGAPVELAELAGTDLSAFAVQALTIGATAMAAAAGVQERYGIESLVAEVEKRSTDMATSAADRTELAVTQATSALQRASEETKKAVVDAGQTARDAFGRAVEAARGELKTQLSTLFGGDEPELLLRLQPVLEQFGRSLEQRSTGQLQALVEKVAQQFDPADPTSPMAQQMRVYTEAQSSHATVAAEQQRLLSEKFDALATTVQVARATQVVLAKSTAKGATYEEEVHACLAQVAAGLGDEYHQTGNVVGLRTRNKKGDGVLVITGSEARVVVEMTDSTRTSWSTYLQEAEDNRGAHASLGLVRTSSQLAGGPLLTLGARRIVMVFDPEQDDPHLLRSVVQVLRLSALAAATRVDSGELETADEALIAALETLDRIGKIRSCADQVRRHASTIGVEAESLLTELNRLLAQARTALAGAIPRERDDVA